MLFILEASKELMLFYDTFELIKKLLELADILEGFPGYMLYKFSINA
jgi:hypothetical protein